MDEDPSPRVMVEFVVWRADTEVEHNSVELGMESKHLCP